MRLQSGAPNGYRPGINASLTTEAQLIRTLPVDSEQQRVESGIC
jgi:hypothetical protein